MLIHPSLGVDDGHGCIDAVLTIYLFTVNIHKHNTLKKSSDSKIVRPITSGVFQTVFSYSYNLRFNPLGLRLRTEF